jgi:hypothetical protein
MGNKGVDWLDLVEEYGLVVGALVNTVMNLLVL